MRVVFNVCDVLTDPEEVKDIIYAQMREFLKDHNSGCISLDLIWGSGELAVEPAGLNVIYGEIN